MNPLASPARHGVNISPARLGFEQQDSKERLAWRIELGGRIVLFRMLRSISTLAVAEALQRDVFGVTDYDLIPASELAIVHETGGEVIGAFVEADGEEHAVGCLFGWGGYVEGRPRVVSDFMAVRPEYRSAGIGAALKRLQAAIALERGFVEIVWTVDPLRAANARLNFEKLGAYCDSYEENKYGTDYGEGLYAGLPSDRLHVTWPIADLGVQERLLHQPKARIWPDVAGVEAFDPSRPQLDRALVQIPNDIDRILASDRATALEWRYRLRDLLPRAFDAGLAITGFVSDGDHAAYLLERKHR